MTVDWVVAGTGSRSLRVAERRVQVDAMERLTDRLERLRVERGDQMMVMSGLAEGWDELVARIALRLGIDLWCAIPNRGYGDHYWRRNSVTGRDRFAEFCEIRDAAWRVTYVMEDIHGERGIYLGGEHSNFVRNRFMVETAEEFVVWDPTSKGTAHCVREIKRAGKWRDDMVLSSTVVTE